MQLLFLSTGIHPMLAFGIPSGPDLIILLVIVLVLFGAKRLPELARVLGQSFGRGLSPVREASWHRKAPGQ